MNFPVPHIPWDGKKSRVKLRDGEHSVTRKTNEDKFLPEFQILCPRIAIRPHQKSEDYVDSSRVNLETLDQADAKVLEIKLTEHHTLPIPVFAPTQRRCGRGTI